MQIHQGKSSPGAPSPNAQRHVAPCRQTCRPRDRQKWHPCRQTGMPLLPAGMPPPVSRALCAGTAQMTHLLAQAPLTKQQRQPLMRSDSCLCIRQITAHYATSSRLAAACCHAAAARDVTRAQGPLSWHRARQGCAMGRACAGHYGAYFSLTLTTARFCPLMASSSYTSLAI